MDVNKNYNEDCVKTLERMPDDFIDLTVTSPPYSDMRNYHGDYVFDFKKIAKELYRVTKKGGIVVWIVGDKTHKGSEELVPFHQAIYFKEIGFKIHDTMIYQKTGLTFPFPNRYYQTFEYMFVMSKGKLKTANLLRTKTKYQKKHKESTGYRQPNGEIRKANSEVGKPTRVLTNVWKTKTGFGLTTKDKFAYKHPAMFPEKLCEKHILTWSNEGDLIYDPFHGSGTTAKMCIINNRNWIGSEISEEYCKIIEQRIFEVKKNGIQKELKDFGC